MASAVEAPSAPVDYSKATDGTKIISVDPWLEPFAGGLKSRYAVYKHWRSLIEQNEGGLDKFSKGYEHMGFHVDPATQAVTYREYAPGVQAASLIGDFNDWNRDAHPMKREEYGRWVVTVPSTSDGKCAIPHGSKVKISMVAANGERIERLPPWIK